MPNTQVPKSKNDYGEAIKYDPDFRGPLKNRSCTDIICLLLFLVFIACWVAIGIYAFKKGDQENILVPRDSRGFRCGKDSAVLNQPYLHFIDISKCVGSQVLITGCPTRQVCVEKCPDKTFYFTNQNQIPDLICDWSAVKRDQIRTQSDAQKYINEGFCSGWYVNSVSVAKRCLPALNENGTIQIPSDIEREITSDSIKEAIKNIKYFYQESITLIAEDIVHSWVKILVGLLMAVVVCLIYIFLMRIMAGFMTWLSILGVLVVLGFCVYGSVMKYLDTKKNATEMSPFWEKDGLWLALTIISSLLLIFALLMLLFLRKRIVIAIALIRQGSKAISATTSTLFFPIFPWLLQIGVLAFAVSVGLYLTTLGEAVYQLKGLNVTQCGCPATYKDGDTCDPKKFTRDCTGYGHDSCGSASCSLIGMINPTYVNIFQAINVVGAFWGVFFVTALGEMTLAATFATWYWTFNKRDVPFFTLTAGFSRTLRYHLGTIAFGSLIITICRLIRVIIEYIDHKMKKFDNEIVKAIMCCCKCFFWCLEKFLKFINRNAYIMCAIHGKNFCASAKDAFGLLMRNIVRVFVLDKVTDMLFFLGKIVITAVTGCIAYYIFTKTAVGANLHYTLVPVICIAIGAFLISCIFFGVYGMAVDTLFLCFLEDCERNDGSPEKPYYMSKELMKILGKKNKNL